MIIIQRVGESERNTETRSGAWEGARSEATHIMTSTNANNNSITTYLAITVEGSIMPKPPNISLQI